MSMKLGRIGNRVQQTEHPAHPFHSPSICIRITLWNSPFYWLFLQCEHEFRPVRNISINLRSFPFPSLQRVQFTDTNTHTHTRRHNDVDIYCTQKPQKYLARQCKWFTALNVLFMRLFNSERGASCALLSLPLVHHLICLLCKFRLFLLLCMCVRSLSLHANIKLQNYHLCTSCGNTNKSQFYGAQFFCCSSCCFISFFGKPSRRR